MYIFMGLSGANYRRSHQVLKNRLGRIKTVSSLVEFVVPAKNFSIVRLKFILCSSRKFWRQEHEILERARNLL